MTLSLPSARERRTADAPGPRWWVLGATLGVLLVAVPLMVSRPAVPAEQVGATTGAVRPHRISRRRWWVLGAVLGVLVVAVTLVVAAPFSSSERVIPVPVPVAASAAVPEVPEVASTSSLGRVASVGAFAAAPLDAPSVGRATADTSGGVAPAAPTEPRATDDAAAGTPAQALSVSDPTRVRIPAIDLDSELIGLGLESDGSMEVPPGAFPAGWYTGAPTPGELGPAVLAGHVDYGGSAGVFSRLGDLERGDTVEVVRQDGSVAVFRVTRVEQHDKDAFPTAAVYGNIDHAGLRLITCGGPFDRRVRSYEDNIVVYAELDTA